jgi:hypothetical protein
VSDEAFRIREAGGIERELPFLRNLLGLAVVERGRSEKGDSGGAGVHRCIRRRTVERRARLF